MNLYQLKYFHAVVTYRTVSLAAAGTVRAEQLQAQPLVLFADTFFQTKMIREWFAKAGASPRVSVQTEQLSTAQNMIENGLAVGLCSKIWCKEATLTAISPEPRILVDVSVLRKKDAFVFRGMKDFERYISEKNPFEKG